MAGRGVIAGSMLLAAIAGCGEDAVSEGDAGQVAVIDGGGGPSQGEPSRLVGTFTIELVEGDASGDVPSLSSMRGFVRNAPAIELTVWEPVDTMDGCVLETPSFPFCDPDCGRGAGCVADDVCQDDPVAVSVGTVTVFGVQTKSGASEFQLTRIGPTYQPEASVDLEYPPAPEGAEVRLATDGGDHAPFEVMTTGIAPLEVNADDNVRAEPEAPLTISWTPPGADASSTVSALVDLSHHGGSKGRIVCEVDDGAGSLTIDASLVTALIELGTAGFPTLKLTRRAVGSTTIESGRVDFSIEHNRELELEIPGLVSCGDTTECPAGETCLPTRKCG